MSNPNPMKKLRIFAIRMSHPPSMRAPPNPMEPRYPVCRNVRISKRREEKAHRERIEIGWDWSELVQRRGEGGESESARFSTPSQQLIVM